jgi:hypothetical protein
MKRCDDMKKICGKIAATAGLLMLITTIVTPMIAADGMFVSDEYSHLYEPYQKAVIYWSGTTETLILSSAVRSDNLSYMAWIVPIISTTMPNVTAGNITVFRDLVDYFREYDYWHYKDWYNEVTVDLAGRVTVLESKEIDIYDVVIIKATNASDLINWLIENNFKVPEEAYGIIEKYVNMDNCYFVVNKIDLKNKYREVLELIENGSITADLTNYLDVFSSSQNFEQFKKIQAMQIICNKDFFVFLNWGQDYYHPEFLINLGITAGEYFELEKRFSTNDQEFIASITPYNLSQKNVDELITDSNISAKYDAVYELLSNKLDPIYDYYQMRQALKQGMATPLKFVFTPLEPYYPLTISSLTPGYGVIEVYVVAEHPATDKNNLLRVEECKEVDMGLREKLNRYFSVENADYVTRLSFHGKLSDLTDDAVFTLYPLSKPERPIFMYVTSELENLTGKIQITGIAWDPDGDVLEVQYKIDNDATWRLADGTTYWSLILNTTTLTNGNHTLYLRALRRNGMSPIYSEMYPFTFSTHNTKLESILQNIGAIVIILISLLVILITVIAAINRKNALHR